MHFFKRYWPYLTAAAVLIAGLFTLVARPYLKLAHRVDREIAAGPFTRTFNYYSSPEAVSLGDQSDPQEIAASLKRCGFREVWAQSSPEAGTFAVGKDSLAIGSTGSGSLPVRIQFAKGVVASIADLQSGANLEQYPLAPQLITNVSNEGREKRVFVKFSDLPPVLVHAIVSAEDKRFFQHSGFDPYRIAKAGYVDFKDHRKEQGASTITMQLARNLWLDRDKRWKRKAAELMITMHLERKLSKEQIMEFYANQVYLGGLGTFSVNGFGEAARVFFNKNLRQLNLPQAAMLAGLIQRPSYFNPLRYPNRALDRRNIVLRMMRENNYIDAEQYAEAREAPLGLSAGQSALSDTQYFVDMAGDEVQKHVEDHEWRGIADVQTTIDLRLQKAAENAIRDGMAKVDREMSRRHKRGTDQTPPQVALIALDPHTGEIKALCGGRGYSMTQLNRVLAKRPPGSVFKPFVYAAALSTGVDASGQVFTPGSLVNDAPTTFRYERQTYSPDNFEHQFHGQVTFRQALAKSMNVAAVRVAEMTGYRAVVSLARRAGMNEDIQPTPSIALGAYQVTPLEIAGAYTIFANSGVREQPVLIDSVRARDGTPIYEHDSDARRVLDARVAYLMVDMLQEVMRSGTAAGVRSMGFKLPAAGKTGTSHDGWFAGFTSNLLCIVWVGYDNYHELNLEGAHSALPIWTQFMMEASHYKKYRDAKPFNPPSGVVRVTVDPASGKLATPDCTSTETSYFISGTQPSTECRLHNGEVQPVVAGDASPASVLESVAAHPR